MSIPTRIGLVRLVSICLEFFIDLMEAEYLGSTNKMRRGVCGVRFPHPLLTFSELGAHLNLRTGYVTNFY